MKQVYALAMTIVLSVFLVVAASAKPAGTSTTADIPLGLKNAKKAMQGKLEHDKMVSQKREKGQELRRQAQKEKKQ